MPTKVEFDLRELLRFNKKLGKKIPIWMEKALTDYGLMLEELIVDEIDRMKLNVSGEMKKSVTHIVREKMKGWLVQVGTNVKTASGYPYPIGVHEGTCPHWPPEGPIREWARRKLNITNEFELRKATYFIRKRISEVGTKAHPFMTNVFTKEKFKIRKEIGKALMHVMRGGKIV